ncbi:MAG TPA: metallophosphoesterase [Candidatus Tenderia electrophaga]|uniref:Metallophosphoesterase n=1 Tax=Candidatus Tenderia electrophaga TaxID=1748243 RepID=A0A832J7F0_9GAMM|nr:metallophosphoesterase [Candidatus Tenderia electrophaga]
MHQDHTFIRRFSLNQQGRDFIVGDIHGCFDELNHKLNTLQFAPKTDRLFAVGDLIDRGPDSYKVLDWLRQPWFHSCLGNHEEMILTTNADSDAGQDWYQHYGGEWWLKQTADSRAEICAAFTQLPVVIELETRHGKVGIVHADIPKGMSWSGFLRLLTLGDMNTRRTALWGRSRIKRFFSSPVKGIDRIVCGHSLTANHKIATKANVWFIETGAYLEDEGSHLTVINTEQLFE